MRQHDWKQALANLPAYDPPPKVWEEIVRELEEEKAIRAGLRHLPEYAPPEVCWSQIEEELDRMGSSYRRILFYAARIAAGLLVLAVLWFLLPGQKDTEQITITYSEEVLSRDLSQAAGAGDEAAFALVEDWCRDYSWICASPEFTNLQKELTDLSSARNRLIEAISPYEENPALRSMLSRIERERSEVLKRMAALM